MLERNRAEFQLWTRKMKMVFAIALIYLASSVGGNVTLELPLTGGVSLSPPIPTVASGQFVEMGGFRIPLDKMDVCPDAIPENWIVFCTGLRQLDIEGTWGVGEVYVAHNERYLSPFDKEQMLSVGGLDPGGQALKHQGECVRFGSRWLKIGMFVRERVSEAWLNVEYRKTTRFITSAGVSYSNDQNRPVDDYTALLTPCGEPAVATPTEFTTYTVVAGDSLTKIARKLKVTPQQLAIANNKKLNGIIQVGEVLIAP